MTHGHISGLQELNCQHFILLTRLQHYLQGRFVQVYPAGELYITDKACSEVCHEEVELSLIVDCDTECP